MIQYICPKDIYTVSLKDNKMHIEKALTLAIGKLRQPVLTSYDLALILFGMYISKKFEDNTLSHLKKNYPDKIAYNNYIKQLTNAGILQQSRNLSHEVFSIFGKTESSAEEISCCIDPFAYVSHISAMEWHGLTDRIAKNLFISSPSPKEWKKFAQEKMLKDIGENNIQIYLENKLPTLRRLQLKKIKQKTVHRHSSLHLGAFISIRDSKMRVSTIGRTFLEMIQQPDLCGGIYHVLETYKKYAPDYLGLIVDEINNNGSDIDKVRAGYIIEERLNKWHEKMDGWRQYTQRGGSRKLYAKGEYSSNYSEKWCLSLNIEE